MPVSKAEADKKCLVFDSGDEFTMLGRRIMVDADDRPYIRFGTGVHDWVGKRGAPVPAIVPITDRFATFAGGRWQVSHALPDDWPAEIKRGNAAPGVLAAGDRWPGGQWFLSSGRRAIQPDAGCQVYLWSEATGYVAPEDGPARVE